MSEDAVPSQAPEHPLPPARFYSVEYPGYVQPASAPRAVAQLGGARALDFAFRRASTKQERIVELRLRPDNPFAHPIAGEVVGTHNLLLRVVRRRRKPRAADGVDAGSGASEPLGEYTAEVVGAIPKTVRFRSMVDFQYTPDMNDPVAKLKIAMTNMDVEGIKAFKVPVEKEDYLVPADPSAMEVDADIDPQLRSDGTNAEAGPSQPKMRSNLRLFPPPMFSRQSLPLNYNYKANVASFPVTVVNEETGEEKTRLVNRMKWKGLSSATISYVDQTVPEKPPKQVEEERPRMNKDLLRRLEEHFQRRPVWSKVAILCQFTESEAREIHNSKSLLPLVAYVFNDGPFRDTHVKFGYDPRQDVDAREYQRLYFRNTSHSIVHASVVMSRQERAEQRANAPVTGPIERSRAHMFDGKRVAKDTASFQLCDIVDPMLRDMIEDDTDLREACDERDGWFSTAAFEAIKTVLRHKYFSLLDGYVASDAECEALLVPAEETGRVPVPLHLRKRRYGKHNMAKGALKPEDAAAARLRAQIEKHATAKYEAMKGQEDVQE